MRLFEKYTQLQDLFDMSSKDWAVMFDELEQLPPSERQAVIRGDYYESPF